VKPITVILPGGGTWSMSADEGRTLARQILRACDAVTLDVIDPTPMPAPALGMRAWFTRLEGATTFVDSIEVRGAGREPRAWAERVSDVDTIDLITDFRTGEVLWRRS
jgi:hypothetical protein